MEKGRLIVAASESNADLLYACGFSAPDDFVYYAVGNKEFIVVSKLELSRAQAEAHGHIVVKDIDDYFCNDEKKRGMNELLIKIVAQVDVNEWEVPSDFPLGYADFLRAADVNVKCGDKLFFPQREIKNESEILKISDAVQKTECGMRRAIQVLEESTINEDETVLWRGQVLTSDILRGEIEVELIRRGAAPFHTIVACGKDSAEPHNAGSGPIYAHKTIVIDIFPRVVKNGYWGDMTRTFVKGSAPETVRLAYQAVREARDNAKDMIKSGVTGAEAHGVAFDTLKARGFETGQNDGVHYGFTHGLGHGVGLEIHEAPRVSPNNTNALQSGNIITVEPGLYYPEWGGIRLEDIGVVRDDRFECFNTIPSELEIP